MPTTSEQDLEFLYVGDPMCSWCWGFAPVLDRLRERYAIGLTTIVGGLRPGPGAQPNSPRLRGVVQEHWRHVEEASGQPFDFTVLDRLGDDWTYDTEPGCRSVVAVRQLAPGHDFAWFKRLQHAFYAEGTDITDPQRHLPLLADLEVPVDPDRFLEAMSSQEVRRQTWDEFALAQSWGITGFPTLLVRSGQEMVVATRGWIAWEHLEAQLTRWLTRQFPADVEGLVCEVGEPC